MIGWLLACSGGAERVGPDIVIVSVDTLRHDALKGPTLEALTERGRVYTQATTPLVRTTPAMASMLSGQLPHNHGSMEVGEPMTAPSLVSEFQKAGWQTVGVSGSAVASAEQGLDAGFDSFALLDDPLAGDLTSRALELLPESGSRFLWVHYTDPHFPYLPPKASAGPCRKMGRKAAQGKVKRWRIFSNHSDRSSKALDHCRELYAGEVAQADQAIGTLLAAFDDPLVVLTSDHGENFGDWGLWFEHGPDVHPATARIPLVIAGPGVESGSDPALVQLQDILPTLMELVGLESPVVDGRSLFGAGPVGAPILSGSALHTRLTGYVRSGRADKNTCLNGSVYSLCTEGFYNHVEDPALSTDLGDGVPEERARLEAAAQLWAPERARQLAVRGATHSLVARPTLEGYERVLFANGDFDTPVEDPTLRALLEPLLPQPPTGSPPVKGQEDALRALGYVE